MSEERAPYFCASPKTDEPALLKAILADTYKPPFNPLGDRLLLKAIDKGPKEINGIIIPDVQTQEGPQEGYVLAVGSGIVTIDYGMGVLKNENKNLELKRGDRVFYNQYQAVKMLAPVDGKETLYHIIHEDQILGIFHKPTGTEHEVRTMWPGWWMAPRGNRVFIEWEVSADTLMDGKLIRPDTMKDAHFTGVVLGLGHTVTNDLAENVKIGDRVFFDQFSTDLQTYNWTHDGKRYGFIRDYDVHCPVPPRLAKEISERVIFPRDED